MAAILYKNPETGEFEEVSTSSGGAGTGIDDTMPSTKTTYSSKKTQDEINRLDEVNAAQDERLTKLEQTAPSGTSGLTVAQTDALNTMFQVVAYDATKNYKVAYKQFKIAFGLAEDDSGGGEDSGGEGGGDSGGTETATYSVTTNLTDVEIDNATSIVDEGASYKATLVPSITDYILDSVTVMMGDVDVTSDVYSNGAVNIPSVTGNVVITAVAVYDNNIAVFQLANEITFDGATTIDTGFAPHSNDVMNSDWSIAFKFSDTVGTKPNVMFDIGLLNNTYGKRFGWSNDDNWNSWSFSWKGAGCRINSAYAATSICANRHVVITHTAGNYSVNMYAQSTDNAAEYNEFLDRKGSYNIESTMDDTIILGGSVVEDGNIGKYCSGVTLHDFRIYSKVMSEAERNAYLVV